MTYAVIEICGKQLKVEAGRFYDLDRIDVELDGELTIDKVLLIHHEDEIHIGQPYIESGSVGGTIIGHRRGKKVIVYKMQPKKKTRKKRGHRQELSRLLINSISLGDNVLAQESIPTVETEVAVEA
jgi:large subunit ribosomal protein L21